MTWLTINGPNVPTAITLLEELCKSAGLDLRLWRRPLILRERGSEAPPQTHRDAAKPPDDDEPDQGGQPSDSEPDPDGSDDDNAVDAEGAAEGERCNLRVTHVFKPLGVSPPVIREECVLFLPWLNTHLISTLV